MREVKAKKTSATRKDPTGGGGPKILANSKSRTGQKKPKKK